MRDGSPTPEIVYRPEPDMRRPGELLRGIFRDVVASRELSWRLFLRDLRGMYRQTLLGLFWAFLPPLANTAIWVFLRSQNVFHFGGELGVHATLYIFCGMVLWQSFIDAFQMPLNTIHANRSMVSKLNFPREALLVQGLADVLFNLGIRLMLLIPAMIWFQAPWSVNMLWALPAMLLLVVLGTALGLLVFPAGSLYQDVGRFWTLAIPFWMILTPIVYVVPQSSAGSMLLWLNPAGPLLVCARDCLVLGATTQGMAGLVYAALTLPLFVVGLLVFRVAMPILVERMAN